MVNYFNIFFGIVSLTFVELFEIVFGDFIVKVFYCFYGSHGKDIDYLKFICGYLITLCSIILLLNISKIGYAFKSLCMGLGCYS